MSQRPDATASHVNTLIHFLVSGFTYIESDRAHGVVSRRGDEVVITQEMANLSIDRLGKSWLDLVSDPAAQLARFGKVVFALGPFPPDLLRTEPGTAEHFEARQNAVAHARSARDPRDRRKALAEVRALYDDPQCGNSVQYR